MLDCRTDMHRVFAKQVIADIYIVIYYILLFSTRRFSSGWVSVNKDIDLVGTEK